MKNEVEKMQIFSDNPLFGFFKNPWTIRIYSDRKCFNLHKYTQKYPWFRHESQITPSQNKTKQNSNQGTKCQL